AVGRRDDAAGGDRLGGQVQRRDGGVERRAGLRGRLGRLGRGRRGGLGHAGQQREVGQGRVGLGGRRELGDALAEEAVDRGAGVDRRVDQGVAAAGVGADRDQV